MTINLSSFVKQFMIVASIAPVPEQVSRIISPFSLYNNLFNPADADNYEFKPVGDGFVMTAHFPDGQTASFIVTPLDGGKSFNLVSLNTEIE